MKILIIDNNLNIIEKNINKYNEIYKKCNYRKNNDFNCLKKWKINHNIIIELHGKKNKNNNNTYRYLYLDLFKLNAFVLRKNNILCDFDIEQFNN